MRSPDLADAFLLTFACGERRKMSAIEGQCGDARLGQRRACYVSKMSRRSPGSPARGFLMSSLGVFAG